MIIGITCIRFWLSSLCYTFLLLPTFKSFHCERTWWILFQICVMRTKLYIYVFMVPNGSTLSECSQNRRIITSRKQKLWLVTLGSLLYTWILSLTDVLSSADKLNTTRDDTAVICDRNSWTETNSLTYYFIIRVGENALINIYLCTYICPIYILRPPKFWQHQSDVITESSDQRGTKL